MQMYVPKNEIANSISFDCAQIQDTAQRCILINKYIEQNVTINMQMYVPKNEIKITCHYALVFYAQTSMVPLMKTVM